MSEFAKKILSEDVVWYEDGIVFMIPATREPVSIETRDSLMVALESNDSKALCDLLFDIYKDNSYIKREGFDLLSAKILNQFYINPILEEIRAMVSGEEKKKS